MPTDKSAPKELKVTDKRIFTAEGEIKDEFKNEIRAAEPAAEAVQPAAAPPPQPEPRPEAKPAGDAKEAGEERRRAANAERGANPGTPFTQFVEPLVIQAYMSLGMMRNPYQPQAKPDPQAARQLIDILVLLKEKTAGNLTPDEEEFLEAHLGELKLAFVQRTKTI